ncbi:helix-hairpin-helix domain-containing protein [Haladaptatus sp. CMSO5]|uniref:helix-hairpin-helix domain-containing protein n=1 Tax=Haladaptatus sp. CMSO5 TaxID=3120514 RepID=UPI002FCE2282
MGLFDWLKSVLGMNGSRPDQRDSERVGGKSANRADTSSHSSSAASTETTATASTETMTDEADVEVGAAEPAEAVGPADTSTEDMEAEPIREAAEEQDDAAAEETDAAASTESMTDEADEEVGAAEPAEAAGPTGDTGEPLTIIKGIGPAYADRLEAAGIGSVADLAAADPGEIGAAIDVSPKRVGRWIERAKHRV